MLDYGKYIEQIYELTYLNRFEYNKNISQEELLTKLDLQIYKAIIDGKIKYETDSEITRTIKQVEKSLGSDGRVLVRASGTESIIRVMIEGLKQEDIDVKAKKIGSKIKKKFGA